MKFNSYAPRSIFTEVFNDRDRQTFTLAYGTASPSQAVRVGAARTWVEDVIHLWADKLPINFSLAVQVIQSGDTMAILRHYRRIIKALEGQKSDIMKMPDEQCEQAMDEWNKAYTFAEGITKLDQADLNTWLRGDWVWALTLTHPEVKRNDFSGKVMNSPKPKIATEGKAATPVKKVIEVSTKRPKLTQEQKSSKAFGHA